VLAKFLNLSHLQSIITAGTCLDHLKYTVIKACFKKRDKSQISNYRPVSLLTGFSKLFELLIFHCLKHNLVSNNILANKQYCFLDNVSTASAIYKLIELIFSVWNNKEHIMGLFCDLAKASDYISHELLIL